LREGQRERRENRPSARCGCEQGRGKGSAGGGGDPDRRAHLAARGERKKGKEKGLTSGPQVSATGKKEKGERGRCWAVAANGPEEGAGPCGVRWVAGFWAKREG
jgi:hypothetical protein